MDIKLKKELAIKLANLILEVYPQKLDPKTANLKITKTKNNSKDFLDLDLDEDVILKFGGKEIEITSKTLFETDYKEFLLKNEITPTFNLSDLEILKSVIEEFRV